MSWSGRKIRRLLPLVIAQYGRTCWLCHLPVDLNRRHPDPLSASIDHRTPRSKGGGDELANLRLAHLRCNLQRGNRTATSSVRSGYRHSLLDSAGRSRFLGYPTPQAAPPPPAIPP